MTDLFVYGSLIFAPVWQNLVTQDYPSLPAFLPRYSRRKILLDNYPVAYPDNSSSGFLGKLYCGMNSRDLQRLDSFEGEIYERVECEVFTAKGRISAQVYRPKITYQILISHVPWTPRLFEVCLMKGFLERYCARR